MNLLRKLLWNSRSKSVRSLYVYDLETTGINPSRNRILKFAAVRLDADAVRARQGHDAASAVAFVKLPSASTIPDPVAIAVNCLDIEQVQEEGLPIPEFAEYAVKEMGQEGTCVVGYNNFSFDGKFMEYILSRNFYEPGALQPANADFRLDMLGVLRDADTGELEFGDSLRLADMAKVNGIQHNPHDALSDAVATAKLLGLVPVKSWESCLRRPRDFKVQESDPDHELFPEIRFANPEELHKFDAELQNNTHKNWLFQYRMRYYPETATERERKKWHTRKKSKFNKTSLEKFERSLRKAQQRHAHSTASKQALKSLENWVQKNVSELKKSVT